MKPGKYKWLYLASGFFSHRLDEFYFRLFERSWPCLNNWFYFLAYDRRDKLSPEKECTSFGRERSGALFFVLK